MGPRLADGTRASITRTLDDEYLRTDDTNGPLSVMTRTFAEAETTAVVVGSWENDFVNDSADVPSSTTVELRGWQTSDPSWWGQVTLLILVAVGATVLFARATQTHPAHVDTLLFFGSVALAGAIGVGAFVRYRVRVDATEVSIRWMRTRLIPWEAIKGLRVLEMEGGKRFALVVHPTRTATAVGRPRDPAAFIDACARLRPAGQGSAASPGPDTPPHPRPVAVVASPWAWSAFAGGAVVFLLPTVGMIVNGTILGWLEWPFSALLALECAVFGAMILWFFPQTRAAMRADSTSFTFARGSKTECIPMGEIGGFLEVHDRSTGSTHSLAVLVGDRVTGFALPRGRGKSRATDLVERLDALRTARSGDERTQASVSDRDSFDPKFRPPWVPKRPFDALVPAVLLGIAAAMLISIPFGFVADRREADRVRARSLPAVGRVTAVNTWSKQPTGLVRLETTSGTITVELDLEPNEPTGAKTLDLLYDPQKPTRVWRAGGGDPPGTSGWAGQVMFALWLPLSLGIALWLRWHPPDTSPGPSTRSVTPLPSEG